MWQKYCVIRFCWRIVHSRVDLWFFVPSPLCFRRAAAIQKWWNELNRQASPSIHRQIWFLTFCFSPLFIKLMLRCVCFSPLSRSGEAGRLSVSREIYEQMFWRVDRVSLDAFNFSIDFNLFDVTWGDKDGGEWNFEQEFGRPSASGTSQLLRNQ